MAIVVESVGNLTTTGNATISVAAPAGMAVGDFLICQIMSETEITTYTGWTLIKATSVGSNNNAVFSRPVTASEVGLTTFDFSSAGASNKAGRILRISGTSQTVTQSSVGANATSLTPTASTITPSVANSLIGIFVTSDTDGTARTTSSYALATDSPTFTEHYDDQFESNGYLLAAATGVRSAITATGDATATLSGAGTDPVTAILIAISPSSPATATTTTVSLTSAGGTTTSKGKGKGISTTASLTVSAPGALGDGRVNPWENDDKTAEVSITSEDKTAEVSITNEDKTSEVSVTNEDKS